MFIQYKRYVSGPWHSTGILGHYIGYKIFYTVKTEQGFRDFGRQAMFNMSIERDEFIKQDT